MKRAIVFWACHQGYYFDMARLSATSAKRQMPDVDAVLLSDRGYNRRPFDRVVTVPRPASVDVLFPPLLHLPEEYSSGIYVGAKCFFVNPVYEAFELVEDDRTDIALTFTSGKRHPDLLYPSPGIPKAFPHFRTGFVAFQHHQRMRDFFALWKDEFEKERTEYKGLRRQLRQGRHTDQSPLRKALYKSDLSIAALPVNFNATLGDEVIRGHIRTFSFRGSQGIKELAAEANRLAPYPRLFVRGKSTSLEGKT